MVRSGFYSLQAENILLVIFSGTESRALLLFRASNLCLIIFTALHCVLWELCTNRNFEIVSIHLKKKKMFTVAGKCVEVLLVHTEYELVFWLNK